MAIPVSAENTLVRLTRARPVVVNDVSWPIVHHLEMGPNRWMTVRAQRSTRKCLAYGESSFRPTGVWDPWRETYGGFVVFEAGRARREQVALAIDMLADVLKDPELVQRFYDTWGPE